MSRNIEIKAHARNFEAQKEAARELSTCEPEIIVQEDIFFKVNHGRLKLRVLSSDCAELIFYTRADQQGPKLSNYEISITNDPKGMKSILESAYGIRATVTKSRLLFMKGRTRIYFDDVESLGKFIELEVVLSEDDDLSEGQNEAAELMESLGIENAHLIECAYVDLLDRANA